MNKPRQEVELLSQDDVARYLHEHPDFFQGHDELLQTMVIEQDNGTTVSLLERQASLLRERHDSVRQRLDDLVSTAERNNDIFDRCRSLILGLLASSNQQEFFAALEESFARDFKCTAYSLIVFGEEPRQINHFSSVIAERSAEEFVGALMRSREPALGILRQTEQDFLFRHASGKVASAAVLTVRADDPIALLAIGSQDPDYFKPALGTLFISFVADTLALLLPKYIDQ